MNVDVQNLANWAQIVALVIASLAFVLQVIQWLYPSQASAQSIIRFTRWLLPLIFVASLFFLFGSRFNDWLSSQSELPEGITGSPALDQAVFQPPYETPTPKQTLIPTKTPSPTPTTDPTLESQIAACNQILENYPQSKEAIVAKFNLPAASQVAVTREGCGNIVTGFSLNGTTEVELELPEGTCAILATKNGAEFDFDRGSVVFVAREGVRPISVRSTPVPLLIMGGPMKVEVANLTFKWYGCSK